MGAQHKFQVPEEDVLQSMPSWSAFLALLLSGTPVPAADGAAQLGEERPPVVNSLTAGQQDRWTAFQQLMTAPNPQQVRIQQRVVVRISPARPRNPALPELPRNFPDRFAERKMGKCVPLNSVAAVQTGGPSKLILYLRDRRIISAELEKACRARDFYSGFYVEPSKDGQLCIDRDELQSRNGAKCELSKFRRLVLTNN